MPSVIRVRERVREEVAKVVVLVTGQAFKALQAALTIWALLLGDIESHWKLLRDVF